ncbi:UDP-glucuronosyltransferase 1A9-like [Argopecten irradians]|uniref:UDP-glucuronosyltransferase 1A9-like n=1 Tax=Argopecten irradians TaxID=31199 RepID=UPI0037138D99
MELAPSYLFSLPDIAKYTPHREKLTSNQLFSKASFHLVETDFLIDYPKPSLPHVAFVGGISTKPSKILSDQFQSFMDSSETGAVIVSFGSGLNGFPSDRMDTLIKAFKQRHDLHFIVKHGLLAHLEGNVMFSPWIPQNDLLGHNKTVAFFTHCGNNGQFEALYHGVPMVGFPLFADQYYNCERMRQRQYGLVLEFCSFDVEDIETALISITTNKKYLYNIRNASHIFHGRSETPLQRASYWIDHVMRYGDTYIHSYCTDIPWYQYYLLDVFMGLTTLIFVIIYLLVQIFKCWQYVCSKSIDKHVIRKAKIH